MNEFAKLADRPEATAVVVVGRELVTNTIDTLACVADVFELRADLLPSQKAEYLEERAKELGALPVLATIRSAYEGGNWRWTDEEKLGLFESLLPHVNAVDGEVESFSLLAELEELAHSADRILVVSSHDFENTPQLKVMEETYRRAIDAGADFVKLAVMAETIQEYERLKEFAGNHRGDNLATVAMGKFGPQSRVELPVRGLTAFTFASDGIEAVAPGQLSITDLRKFLQYFDPGGYGRLEHR